MSEEVKDGDVSGETKEFDPSAFGSGIVETVENNTEETPEIATNESSEDSAEVTNSKDDDDNESFDWSNSYKGDETDNTEEEKSEVEDSSANENNDNTETEVLSENNNTDADKDIEKTPSVFDGSLTDEHFSAFADELGIKATSMTELKDAMLKLEEDNKRLQQNAGSNVTNKKIDSLQGYLKLDDKELLQKDLEAQGFKGDQLQEAMDTLQDNGMLKVEATKVRNAINGSIENERSAITQSTRDEDAKQLKEREESVKALNTYISNQTEMFGFKMAKDEETLGKVRDSHHKYITSGNFLKDITKNNESLAESAWLWKNRETLLKAARNGGLQQGRSEILNDLHNPDTDKGKGFVSPDGKGEFNVSQFRGSANKK